MRYASNCHEAKVLPPVRWFRWRYWCSRCLCRCRVDVIYGSTTTIFVPDRPQPPSKQE